MEEKAKPHLYYWNIRGLGSFIQMAFYAAGVEFNLTEYTPENEPQWFERDKPALKMTLPNLPYIKDGAVEISEHDAIFRHVLRKYKPELLGKSIDEESEIDQFITFWAKTNIKIRMYCYEAKDATDEDKKKHLDQYKAQLESINHMLEGRSFTMGDHLTGADIFLFETYWMISVVHKGFAESYANIAKVAKNVEEQEWFKKYRASEKWRNQLNWYEAFINNE